MQELFQQQPKQEQKNLHQNFKLWRTCNSYKQKIKYLPYRNLFKVRHNLYFWSQKKNKVDDLLGQTVDCLIHFKLWNIMIFGIFQVSSVLCFLSCQGRGQEKFLPSHTVPFFCLNLSETRFMQLHYSCISSSLLTPEPFVQTFHKWTEVSKIIKFWSLFPI